MLTNFINFCSVQHFTCMNEKQKHIETLTNTQIHTHPYIHFVAIFPYLHGLEDYVVWDIIFTAGCHCMGTFTTCCMRAFKWHCTSFFTWHHHKYFTLPEGSVLTRALLEVSNILVLHHHTWKVQLSEVILPFIISCLLGFPISMCSIHFEKSA